jgi:integrase
VLRRQTGRVRYQPSSPRVRQFRARAPQDPGAPAGRRAAWPGTRSQRADHCGQPGELTGLLWENVDLGTGVITIWESLKHRKGKLWQGDTKTLRSHRKIKALPITLEALKNHKACQAAERLAAGTRWQDTGHVFTTQAGTPIDPANLRRAFRALLKSAGIPAKQPTEDCPKPGQWHPNEMRHSAGSYMEAMGVPPKRVASILGHEGTRTTEGVYIHGQEVIDMTSPGFESYGNQFGNQSEEGTQWPRST